MVVAVGMLVGGVVGTGCDLGEGEACVLDEDCTKEGETCIEGTFSSVCGCDPTAAVDSCTEANLDNVCHPDRKVCEKSCVTDKDCTSGETCDWDEVTETGTGACRAEGAKDDCTQPGNACATGEVCDATAKKCIADCRVTGNECAAGKECDSAGICVDECGGNVCTSAQYCNDAGTACVDKCVTSLDCGVDECDTATGKCVPFEGCTTNLDCANDGGFCNASGGCETFKDISECSTSVREYVKFETNTCEPTSGNLGTCGKASQRDDDKKEVAAGPTLFNAQQFGAAIANDAQCGGPAVKIFVQYYDASGGMLNSTGGIRNTAPWQAVSGMDSAIAVNTPHEVCKGQENEKVGTYCKDIVSTGNWGAFVMLLCRTKIEAEEVAIYLRDGAENYGNSFCVELNK